MRTCSQKNIEENLRRIEAGFHQECQPADIDAQRTVDLLDMDAAVLDRFNRIGNF